MIVLNINNSLWVGSDVMASIPMLRDTRTPYEKMVFDDKFNEINDGESVYEWSVLVTPTTKRWFFSFLVTLGPCILFTIMFFIISISTGKTAIIILPTFGLILALLFRYLIYPDILYQFKITKKGICSTKQQVLPKSTAMTVQIIAWCCVGAFVLAMALVGPIALVGAGGGIVLAFGFLNFKPKVDKDYYFFNDINILSTLSTDKYFLINDKENYQTIGIIFFFIPSICKEKIISSIKNNCLTLKMTDNTAAGDNQEKIIRLIKQ